MSLDENLFLAFTDVKKLDERIAYLKKELLNPIDKTVMEMNEEMAELYSYEPYLQEESLYTLNNFN